MDLHPELDPKHERGKLNIVLVALMSVLMGEYVPGIVSSGNCASYDAELKELYLECLYSRGTERACPDKLVERLTKMVGPLF